MTFYKLNKPAGIKWSIAGKVIDIYDDPHLDEAKDGIEKIGSLTIDPKEVARSYSAHHYALNLEDETGKIHPKFPVYNEEQIKLSAYYLEKTGDRLLPYAKNTAAKFLVKVAKIAEIPMPEKIINWSAGNASDTNYAYFNDQKRDFEATYRSPRPEPIEKEAEISLPENPRSGVGAGCMARADLIDHPEIKADLHDLAKVAHKLKSEEVIEILESIDEEFNLKKYAHKIGTPQEVVCSELETEETIKVGEREVPLSGLITLSKRQDLLDDVFNPGFRNEFMADPKEVFSTLPRQTKDMIIDELLPKV